MSRGLTLTTRVVLVTTVVCRDPVFVCTQSFRLHLTHVSQHPQRAAIEAVWTDPQHGPNTLNTGRLSRILSKAVLGSLTRMRFVEGIGCLILR